MKKTSLFCLFSLALSLLSMVFIGNNSDCIHPVLANEETHFHLDKDGNEVIFEPIYNTDDFITLIHDGGNAYLANDITFTESDEIEDGEIMIYAKNISLCLNGYVLNFNGLCHLRSDSQKGHHFSIYDCNKTKEHRFDTTSIPWKLDPLGDTVINNGVITGGYSPERDGGFLNFTSDEDEVNIYDGTIVGNVASASGAIESWFFSMFGGEICGNKADVGGAIMGDMEGQRFFAGGKIHDNVASIGGGIITFYTKLDGAVEIYNNFDTEGNSSNLSSVFIINNLNKNCDISVKQFNDYGYEAPIIFEQNEDANDILSIDQPEFYITKINKNDIDEDLQEYVDYFIDEYGLSEDKIFTLDNNGKLTNEITNFVMNDYYVDETPSTPSATATFGTPSFAYSAEEYGVYSETQPTEVGKYWVRARVEETGEYFKAIAKKQFKIKEREPESPVKIDIEGGIPDDVSVLLEITAENEVEDAIKEGKITDYSSLPEDIKLIEKEKVGVVFTIKLIRTIGGISTEIQPSDIRPGAIVEAKFKLPDNIDVNKASRIIHVQSKDNVESYAFDATKIDADGYYTLHSDKLLEFAFVYDSSTVLDIEKANNLSNIYERILTLKAIGYDVEYDEESNEFGILDIVNAPNEAILRTAYFNSLKLLDKHVSDIKVYRQNKINEIQEYASTNDVIVTSSYLSYFESIYTTEKLDEATSIVKAEIDDVVSKKDALDTKFDELKDAVDAVKSAVDTGFSDTSTAITSITTTIDAINALLNDETNGLAKINLNIDATKTAITDAITDAVSTLTQLINENVSDIEADISALSSKVDGDYADLLNKISEVKSLIESTKELINSSSSASVTELKNAINEAETKIDNSVNALNDKIASLEQPSTNNNGILIAMLIILSVVCVLSITTTGLLVYKELKHKNKEETK